MAKKNNLYCPECGSKLWYSQSDKSYRCPNSSCPRSPNYQEFSKAEKVAQEAEDEVEALL